MSGVYIIKCRPTGKIYVGSTVKTFRTRFSQHRAALRCKRKGPTRLQNAWDKYGEDAFEFICVGVCPANEIRDVEQTLIDLLKPELNTQTSAKNALYRPSKTVAQREAAAARARAAWQRGDFADRKRPAQKFAVCGDLLTRAEICARYSINMPALQARIHKGLRGDDLIQPIQLDAQRLLVRGELLRISEISKRYGLGEATVLYRVKGGATGEALVKPSRNRRGGTDGEFRRAVQ